MYEIKVGDALAELKKMADESVDCIVTSPPYWGLRDYGVDGQLGLEKSLAEHMAVMVAIFEECRRVLKPHGTLWLNYGDCYATSPNGKSAADTKSDGKDDRTYRDKPFSTVGPIFEFDDSPRQKSRAGRSGNLGNGGGGKNGQGIPMGRVVAGGYLKEKDLCMLPARIAIALQDAGWWVRAEIVWGKPNAMPDSSGVQRPASAHEKIFLLTKSGDADIWRARDTGELSFQPDLDEKCPLVTDPSKMAARWSRIGSHYDAEAVKMPVSDNTNARLSQDVMNQIGSDRANAGKRRTRPMKAVASKTVPKKKAVKKPAKKSAKSPAKTGRKTDSAGSKNRNNPSFDEAMQLPVKKRLLRNYEPDLSAIVPDDFLVWEIPTVSSSIPHFATFPPALVAPCIMAGCPEDGIVLDPFGGVGTTALVANLLGRHAIMIELSEKYAQLASDNLKKGTLTRRAPRKKDEGQTDMFGDPQ